MDPMGYNNQPFVTRMVSTTMAPLVQRLAPQFFEKRGIPGYPWGIQPGRLAYLYLYVYIPLKTNGWRVPTCWGLKKLTPVLPFFSICVKFLGCDVVCYFMEPNLFSNCFCSIGFPENPGMSQKGRTTNQILFFSGGILEPTKIPWNWKARVDW